MSFLPADPLNCEIIALSLQLQRSISLNDGPEGPSVGAQQTMPKPEHAGLFGPSNPLPWVPNMVGEEFSTDERGILVVGSSYNGFIEGYCQRCMRLEDYVSIRNLILEGNEDPTHSKVAEACSVFVREFERQIVDPDQSTYYGPILNSLLLGAGIRRDRVCLTDLCKASFVKKGARNANGTRLDIGDDGVVRRNWKTWTQFLTYKDPGQDTSLSYNWIWRRMQQCRHIIALGTIAEYGILKIFHEMARSPSLTTRNGPDVKLTPSLVPGKPWSYCYADQNRKLSHWRDSQDWWVLCDGPREWSLLPVCHPAARPPFSDPGYKRASSILKEMVMAGEGQQLLGKRMQAKSPAQRFRIPADLFWFEK